MFHLCFYSLIFCCVSILSAMQRNGWKCCWYLFWTHICSYWCLFCWWCSSLTIRLPHNSSWFQQGHLTSFLSCLFISPSHSLGLYSHMTFLAIGWHRVVIQEASSPNRTLDLASALETGPAAGNKTSSDAAASGGTVRSVMTIAFEFAFESHMQDSVASMARQYVRSVISSVQRVAIALSPSQLGSHGSLQPPLGTPEAHTLARWICQSYRQVPLIIIFRSFM